MRAFSYIDPLIPLQESAPAKLTRLSSNIETLTQLIDVATHRGLERLAMMFARSRSSEIEQARACAPEFNGEP